ncbi:MAG: YebC/PmpR family DNA-binding transcriptional regulator [Deltaproteobacteria bacterium]|nr:YebC/PmpR family DNA-binding transcriptional regulator [Deltaproteobacteria bacterium]MBW2361071.1 YebC/PmpR family DNA-binding transcriptional regulator [Deltaproteobacteria bacterium]
MSGHSKWSTIKRKKGVADAKRGKIFTKLIREIATAARMGGGDSAANPRLRLAMDKARIANMPKDNIVRAIKKGTGGTDSDAYEEAVYEGYGPGGAAVLVETLTDNKNRTVGEVRHVFTKFGGNLGANGCVSYLFEKKGLIQFDAEGIDSDVLLEVALEAGADDVVEGEGHIEVATAPSAFEAVKGALEAAGFAPAAASISLEPSTTVALEGKDVETMLSLADALEDLDDVQSVNANFDLSDAEMSRLAVE